MTILDLTRQAAREVAKDYPQGISQIPREQLMSHMNTVMERINPSLFKANFGDNYGHRNKRI